ncbi:carbohydrate sulfotransferase 1 [Procambarus clarkii]|uniref:carbohydrate sulfotransferase 1 n=1 Tax=Procambarus clarkii TaxID=6728 RepID=UPI001E674C53|nr:carbohydrate sulfotransferase 1-like [Procambarus clarkii]XP_045612674.1 carbohydrate sulfotransferase 1-like [Procambarus clarkii]XP_045612675.1 carbohydrate sulfotransferase 1-like [Procambarus clarkii]
MGRRRWLGASCGLLLAGYLTLTTLTYLIQIARPTGESDGVGAEQYTLPSLEEVMQGVHDLDVQRVLSMHQTHHLQVPATPPVRVVVSSTWRSGSTLLAEILAAHPGVFYHYEPLMSYGLQQLAPSNTHQGEVERVLRGLLQCDYRNADDYLKFAFINHEMFVRNTRLWSMCSAMPRTKCYNPDTLARLCSLFPIHVMKVVRARLDLLAPLLRNPHVRLVWLVRDPRAVMSSRRNSVSWCQTRSCSDPGYLCSDLQADFSAYLLLKEDFPGQVMLLRYEDLARSPYDKSREVLQFAGLSFQRQVQEYLDDHLTSDEDEPWSTRHDPMTRVGRWMKIMQFEDVMRTQYHCQGIMKNLGYRLFASKSDMDNGNAVGLLNIP